MPVELPVSTIKASAPKAPRAIAWLALFTGCMLVGVVGTMLTWPAAEPTGSGRFWAQSLAFPALAWSLAFGLRMHYYEEEQNRLAAEEDTQVEDRATVLRFASDPLAILGSAYLCALGNANAAGNIARGAVECAAQTPRSGGNALRHTALDLGDDANEPGRYRACFGHLLDGISEKLAVVPRAVPFIVRLHLPPETNQAQLLKTWQSCWEERALRPVEAALLPAGQGLMALDEWLDIPGGPTLERFALFVSVQLHETPPLNSAEAAVALLFGWAPLAARRGVKPVALLHRPVECAATTADDAISTALLWGRTDGSKIEDLWQAGLESQDKPVLVQAASDLSLGVSRTDKLSGIHDVDVALGHSGAAAGWLAVALAIEHAEQYGKPQLATYREGTLRFGVVQPLPQANTAAETNRKW
jgi:hypothetical protein